MVWTKGGVSIRIAEKWSESGYNFETKLKGVTDVLVVGCEEIKRSQQASVQ